MRGMLALWLAALYLAFMCSLILSFSNKKWKWNVLLQLEWSISDFKNWNEWSRSAMSASIPLVLILRLQNDRSYVDLGNVIPILLLYIELSNDSME